MHRSVLRWVSTVLPVSAVVGRRVLEVGSGDVNGSVRPAVEAHRPTAYIGVDAADGPGVDLVVDCAELVSTLGANTYDIVITTEMLEHVVDWRPCVAQMCEVLRPGGTLVLTTRSPGFPYHPYPIDTWRYTLRAMGRILDTAGLLTWQLIPDPDPESPGVFAVAHKPLRWVAPWAGRTVDDVFAGIHVEAVQAP